MPYTALPDHRIPYDNDGTIVYHHITGTALTGAQPNSTLIAWQDEAFVGAGTSLDNGSAWTTYFFFPEQREITGIYGEAEERNGPRVITSVQGSNDTANGLDGTWETASLPAGAPPAGTTPADVWRTGIRAVSFTGPKQSCRVNWSGTTGGTSGQVMSLHLYGEAAPGAMAHDLVFVDQDAGVPGVFQAPEDFGDQPLGTTVVRQFRLRNTSATRTATNINLQCNDSDFAIAENPAGPWVVTIGIPSLAPGAETATLYVRCTTPAPGGALGPRFARMIVICDPGFFG